MYFIDPQQLLVRAIYVYLSLSISLYICVCIYICMLYTYTYRYISIYIYMYMYVYMYIYIYIYIYMYMIMVIDLVIYIEGPSEPKAELMYFNDPQQLLVRAIGIYVYIYVYTFSYISRGHHSQRRSSCTSGVNPRCSRSQDLFTALEEWLSE